MKKLLKHALLICAGLSAGVLYAPNMPAATTPDDYGWWTEHLPTANHADASQELLERIKNPSKLGLHRHKKSQNSRNKILTVKKLKNALDSIAPEEFSLKQLYYTAQVQQTECPNTAEGCTSAFNTLKSLAQAFEIPLDLEQSDITGQNLNNPLWLSLRYPLLPELLTTEWLPPNYRLLACQGLKTIVAYQAAEQTTLNQAIQHYRKNRPSLNDCSPAALNNAIQIIRKAQALALKNERERTMPPPRYIFSPPVFVIPLMPPSIFATPESDECPADEPPAKRQRTEGGG